MKVNIKDDSYYTNTVLVITYMYIVFEEYMSFLWTYMILSLPPYMFGPPILHINYENDDSDDESQNDEFDIYAQNITLVSTKNNVSYTDSLNIRQLTNIINNSVLHIKELQIYYPYLDTIYIQLFRCDTQLESTMIIDTKKRVDIYHNRSVRNGINLIKDLVNQN
jgi:hypothetical protein